MFETPEGFFARYWFRMSLIRGFEFPVPLEAVLGEGEEKDFDRRFTKMILRGEVRN